MHRPHGKPLPATSRRCGAGEGRSGEDSEGVRSWHWEREQGMDGAPKGLKAPKATPYFNRITNSWISSRVVTSIGSLSFWKTRIIGLFSTRTSAVRECSPSRLAR